MNAIETLEKIEEIISHDKAMILLVHGGLKPSCLAVFYGPYYNQTKEILHIDKEDLQIFKNVLDELGLCYHFETRVYENEGEAGTNAQEIVRAYIAKDQEKADILAKYFSDLNKYDYEAGILLGYPKTAVQAYVDGTLLPMDDVASRTDEVSTENMRLLGYRLSREDWKEEVRPLEIQGNYLKKISPRIYKESIE